MEMSLMRPVIVIFLLGFADALDFWFSKNATDETATPHKEKMAFAFAPGGLAFPYYLGAAYQLRDLGLLKDSTPIGGTSAGSIVASAIAFGKSEQEVKESMVQLMKDVQKGEQLKDALMRQLQKLVPEDAPVRAKNHGLAVGYLEVFPHPGPRIVTSWESKQDFIETILASCNFPFYFSHFQPLVRCRNSWAIDGMFAVEGERFGCPHLPGERTVAVVASMADRVNMADSVFDYSDVIQPGHQGMELPHDLGALQWLHWSLSPAPDDGLEKMIALGKAHVKRWAVQEKLVPGFIEWQPPWSTANVAAREKGRVERPQQQAWPIPSFGFDARQEDKVQRPRQQTWPIPSFGWPQAAQPATAAGALPLSTKSQRIPIPPLSPTRQLFPKGLRPMSLRALDRINTPFAAMVAVLACGGVTFVVLRLRFSALTAGKEPLLAE